MADWTRLKGGAPSDDFLSIYMSQSLVTPMHSRNGSVPELQFSPSPPKACSPKSLMNGHDDEAFCRKDNVDQCIAFINQEATSIGMPSLYDGKTQTFDIVRLINCSRSLLQKHQRSQRLREELENKHHRSICDLDCLQQAQLRLRTTLEQCERDLAQAQEKERQTSNKNKLLTNKLKMEKEEVWRLQSVIQHRDAQYKHEAKKKEREHAKLKERLHSLLTMKNERKIGIEISNALQRPDGKRGTWNTGNKHEEEMYRQVISNYEEKQKDLMVENAGFRTCLSDIQRDLVALLHSPLDDSGTSNNSQVLHDVEEVSDLNASIDASVVSNQEDEDASQGHFQQPYDIMRDNVLKSMKDKWRLLKQQLNKQKGSRHGEKRDRREKTPKRELERYKQDIDGLHKQILRYHEIIEEQEQLLQQNLQSSEAEDGGLGFLHESDLLEERESLASEKERFYEQKANFEDERKKFTEAAIRLCRERKTFEDEKAAFLQHQFLQLTPFQPRANRGHVQIQGYIPPMSAAQKPKGKRCLPSTPNFLPAPFSESTAELEDEFGLTPSGRLLPRQPPTPTTVDLYRTLGLVSGQSVQPAERPRSASEALYKATSPATLDVSPRQRVSSARPSSCRTLSGTRSAYLDHHVTHSANHMTPPSSSPSSRSSSRLSEHVDGIKMTLFGDGHQLLEGPEELR